ncbi:MAG: hypothetical protein D3923_04555 [Candidatus Electrothrix sp. AR3]|nr:hypothetical protein [Candidatus Electrothrix sp. AR3]
MKTRIILLIAVFCASYISSAAAGVDKHELLMLNTAKNLEYVSQKITKAYFYKQLNIRVDHAERDLQESLANLKNGLLKLQAGITGKEEKDIMAFLGYTHDEMLDILSKPYSKEHGALMIDYGESLLEGAEFLSLQHRQKKQNGEEAMLVETERLLFLLERINKLYIAHKAGFKDYNNIIQIEQAVADFENGMSKVNTYGRYPGKTQENVGKINKFWPMAKTFYLGKKGALPTIVLASTDKLEHEVSALKKYHHQAAIGRKK